MSKGKIPTRAVPIVGMAYVILRLAEAESMVKNEILMEVLGLKSALWQLVRCVVMTEWACRRFLVDAGREVKGFRFAIKRAFDFLSAELGDLSDFRRTLLSSLSTEVLKCEIEDALQGLAGNLHGLESGDRPFEHAKQCCVRSRDIRVRLTCLCILAVSDTDLFDRAIRLLERSEEALSKVTLSKLSINKQKLFVRFIWNIRDRVNALKRLETLDLAGTMPMEQPSLEVQKAGERIVETADAISATTEKLADLMLEAAGKMEALSAKIDAYLSKE